VHLKIKQFKDSLVFCFLPLPFLPSPTSRGRGGVRVIITKTKHLNNINSLHISTDLFWNYCIKEKKILKK
jgi:hypothetical protein